MRSIILCHTLAQLRKLAAEKKIPGRSKMNRDELEAALRDSPSTGLLNLPHDVIDQITAKLSLRNVRQLASVSQNARKAVSSSIRKRETELRQRLKAFWDAIVTQPLLQKSLLEGEYQELFLYTRKFRILKNKRRHCYYDFQIVWDRDFLDKNSFQESIRISCHFHTKSAYEYFVAAKIPTLLALNVFENDASWRPSINRLRELNIAAGNQELPRMALDPVFEDDAAWAWSTQKLRELYIAADNKAFPVGDDVEKWTDDVHYADKTWRMLLALRTLQEIHSGNMFGYEHKPWIKVYDAPRFSQISTLLDSTLKYES